MSVCEHCGKSFSSNKSLTKHIRLVCRRGEPSFECNDCSRKFYEKYRVEAHIKLYHLRIREEELQCEKCGQRFCRPDSLKRHRENVPCGKLHEKGISQYSNVFTCLECKKEFSGQLYLKQHIQRTHMGIKKKLPVLCTHCGRQFSEKKVLQKHISKLHNGSRNVVEQFVCLKCDAKFEFATLAQKHYIEEHNIEMEYEDLQFESVEEFEQWKLSFMKTHVIQMKLEDKWKNSTYSMRKFVCHRSGLNKCLKGPRKRALRTVGSKKLGGYCPMEINVKENRSNGTCCVTVQKTHVGHSIDNQDELRFIRPDDDERSRKRTKIQRVPRKKTAPICVNNNGFVVDRICGQINNEDSNHYGTELLIDNLIEEIDGEYGEEIMNYQPLIDFHHLEATKHAQLTEEYYLTKACEHDSGLTDEDINEAVNDFWKTIILGKTEAVS